MSFMTPVLGQSHSLPSFLQPLMFLSRLPGDPVDPVRFLAPMCEGTETGTGTDAEARAEVEAETGRGAGVGAGTRRLLKRLHSGQSNCILSVSSIISICDSLRLSTDA